MEVPLQREGTNVSGTALLEGVDTPASLSGSLPRQQNITLTADGAYSDFRGWGVTNLTGEIQGEPAQCRGWVGVKGLAGTVPFAASNVASLEQCQRRSGLSVAGRGGGKEFTASWPQFRGESPFPRAISAQLAAEARGEAGTFVTGGLGVAWEGFKVGGARWSWEGMSRMHLAWLSAECVSLLQEGYAYTGGAHGNTVVVGRNFLFREGKARELALTNLFRAGVAWEKRLSQLCLRDLRRQHAGFVVDGTVKKLAAAEMASFTFDRRGLVIHFQDYLVGPHSEGLFSVFLPWSQLRQLLDPAGPAQFLPGALAPR